MTVRALVIGQNYPNTGMTLEWCIYDAERMRDWICANAREADLAFLTNQTAEEIRKAVAAFAESVGPDDHGFLTYSGHGTYVADRSGGPDVEPDGRDECWVGQDGFVVTDDEIRVRLTRARGPVAVFSDSCFSGSVTRMALVALFPTLSRPRTIPSPDPGPPGLAFHGRILPTGGGSPILLHSGCRDDELSYETANDPKGGVFTTALLSAWQPGMTHRQLHKAVRERLPTREFKQHPQLFGSQGMPKRPVFPA